MVDATRLHADSLVWDAHSCLPLRGDVNLGVLERHRRAGVNHVSINVGMDFNPLAQVIRTLAGFRHQIAQHPEQFVLGTDLAAIEAARAAGRLSIAFDLEGSMMLEDDLAMVGLYRDLGVRQMHLAYNRNNSVSAGCHDEDRGLTAFGREVVREVQARGILLDLSHSGVRASLEIVEQASRPVVFSHANAHHLTPHARNARDEQIDAVAATGGVIGITGVSLFLGDPAAGTEAMIRHIEYVADRVGWQHVGLGLDFNFLDGVDDRPAEFDARRWWPDGNGYGPGMHFATPEQLPEITAGLVARGWPADAIQGVLGENFRRVAARAWGSPTP
ncbi:MAG: membrane dipeptidase [Alphaproteobacteria bacterium]|nr:membrane dipeptidase [Alphaproteobacteria bacterium]